MWAITRPVTAVRQGQGRASADAVHTVRSVAISGEQHNALGQTAVA